jgi:tubulin beta
MGTEFWEMVCDEHSIGGNDAQLGRIKSFNHEASGRKYVSRAVFFDLEPGVIGLLRASPLGELSRPGNFVNQNAGAGNSWAKGHYTKAGHKFF